MPEIYRTQPEARPLIEAYNLSKRFGDFTAVKDVSLCVEEGQILALLGHNGAGKTTTTRMLAAILTPTSGQAVVAGYNTVEQPLEVRKVIGHLTEQPGLYNRMRILEYLDFFGQLLKVPEAEIVRRSEKLLHQFDLWDTRNLRMGEYSKGMRQKAALIRALIHQPKILFLDEPTSAMDPFSAKMVRDAISELKRNNCAIILCTHNLVEAEILADRIAIIRKGEIIITGTSEELKHRLLGAPRYQVELNSEPVQIPETVLNLPDFKLVEQVQNGFIYETGFATQHNPKILKSLAASGLEVVTLSQIPQSLETVYLKIAGAAGQYSNNRDEIEQSILKDSFRPLTGQEVTN